MATTTTSDRSYQKPGVGDSDWGLTLNTSLDMLDSDIGGLFTTTITNTATLTSDVLKDVDLSGKGALLSASAAGVMSVETVGADNRTLRAISTDTNGLAWDARRYVQMTVFEYATDTATGDGAAYLHIPAHLAGLNLVEIHGEVITAGTTNTLDVQIANVTQAVDMLTTKLTIDTGETGSDTAATAAVIDTANDDVAVNDLLRVDVDAVHTTAAKGLIVTLGFA